ncbi:hypothetical protein GCM10009837_72680 [Streptomyces durmitorensis]
MDDGTDGDERQQHGGDGTDVVQGGARGRWGGGAAHEAGQDAWTCACTGARLGRRGRRLGYFVGAQERDVPDFSRRGTRSAG